MGSFDDDLLAVLDEQSLGIGVDTLSVEVEEGCVGNILVGSELTDTCGLTVEDHLHRLSSLARRCVLTKR